MQDLVNSFKDLLALAQNYWWLSTLAIVGLLSFVFYRIVDMLQISHVKSQTRPEDLKNLPEEVYNKKQQSKAKRSSQLLWKGGVSWSIQVIFIAAMPFLIGALNKAGVTYGYIYVILMISSFILNMLLSKLFPLWNPARPYACRAFQHERVWRPGNMAFQAWGVASWAVPAYYLWDFFQVKGWIGSVIFIVISQVLQLIVFIFSIKKAAIPYQQYDGLSDKFKQNLHKYLEGQGFKDEEVGVLAGMGMGPNAFATNILGYRQIVITEELIKGYKDPSNPQFELKLSEDTVESITAHEVGHIRYRHIEKSVGLGMIISSLTTIAVYNLFSGAANNYLVFSPDTTQQLLLYWGQSIFNIMLMYPITFLMLGIGRSNEWQADTHLLETNGCKNGQDFFYQIRHIAPVTNHPAWHSCNQTHPPAEVREARMRKWSEENCSKNPS